MNKIVSKVDAMDLAVMMVIDEEERKRRYLRSCHEKSPLIENWYCPGYDAEKPSIKLRDDRNSNCIMIFIEQDKSWLPAYGYKMSFIDTVNGTEHFCTLSLCDVANTLWANRKSINRKISKIV